MEFLREWFQDTKQVLTEPSDFYRQLQVDGYSDSTRYAATTGAVLGGVLSVLTLISVLVNAGSVPLSTSAVGLLTILLIPVFAAVGVLFNIALVAALTHLGVYILGMRGHDKTFAAFAYATATLTLMWIPLVNFLVLLYAFYIEVRGIQMLHDTSLGKALLAVLVVPLVLVVLVMLAGFLLGSIFSVAAFAL